jgi:hypothetical protein
MPKLSVQPVGCTSEREMFLGVPQARFHVVKIATPLREKSW